MLSDDLLALQRVDTAIDESLRRRARLPERDTATAASGALKSARQQRSSIAKRQEALEAAVAAAEADGAALTAQRERLQAQLKTVIAPREAEALMHEIATITERRDALDDVELEHLEEDGRLGEELAQIDVSLPTLESAAAAADAELAAAEADVDAAVAALRGERDVAAAVLDSSTLADYEAKRIHFAGVAVATLSGRTCTGCHLDLSTSEFDQARRLPPGSVIDCPQCGRLLVP